jgi:hypothetical protein
MLNESATRYSWELLNGGRAAAGVCRGGQRGGDQHAALEFRHLYFAFTGGRSGGPGRLPSAGYLRQQRKSAAGIAGL